MTNFYFWMTGVLGILMIALLLWVMADRRKIKKEFQALSNIVNRSNRDIAGMCTAAISVDERLGMMDARLKEYALALKGVQAKLADVKKIEATPNPYSEVIQKVQAGATMSELMQNFGLSGDEATLLIRLHGAKN